MPIVVVSYGEDANRWARQYCRQAAWTRGRGMPAAVGTRQLEIVRVMSTRGIVEAVERAARRAGAGGEVIYSVGHGNAAAVGATAQLGEAAELTVNQEILRADASGHYGSPSAATGLVTLSAADQAINTAFRQIGAALVSHQVRQFTFLVCVLGNNPTFLQQIKDYWGGSVSVAGYRGYVVTMTFEMQGDASYPRTALYLTSDASGRNIIGGTNAEPRCFLELPDQNYLRVV